MRGLNIQLVGPKPKAPVSLFALLSAPAKQHTLSTAFKGALQRRPACCNSTHRKSSSLCNAQPQTLQKFPASASCTSLSRARQQHPLQEPAQLFTGPPLHLHVPPKVKLEPFSAFTKNDCPSAWEVAPAFGWLMKSEALSQQRKGWNPGQRAQPKAQKPPPTPP